MQRPSSSGFGFFSKRPPPPLTSAPSSFARPLTIPCSPRRKRDQESAYQSLQSGRGQKRCVSTKCRVAWSPMSPPFLAFASLQPCAFLPPAPPHLPGSILYLYSVISPKFGGDRPPSELSFLYHLSLSCDASPLLCLPHALHAPLFRDVITRHMTYVRFGVLLPS